MSASTTNKQVSTTRNEHKPKINMQQTNKLTNSKQQQANNNQQTTTNSKQQQSANNNNKQQTTTNSKQQSANNNNNKQQTILEYHWTIFPQLYYACNHENDYKYRKIDYYCGHSFIMCGRCFDAYGTCPFKCFGGRQKPVPDNKRFVDEGGHDRRPLPLPDTEFILINIRD
jgi:hypothetical protein